MALGDRCSVPSALDIFLQCCCPFCFRRCAGAADSAVLHVCRYPVKAHPSYILGKRSHGATTHTSAAPELVNNERTQLCAACCLCVSAAGAFIFVYHRLRNMFWERDSNKS